MDPFAHVLGAARGNGVVCASDLAGREVSARATAGPEGKSGLRFSPNGQPMLLLSFVVCDGPYAGVDLCYARTLSSKDRHLAHEFRTVLGADVVANGPVRSDEFARAAADGRFRVKVGRATDGSATVARILSRVG